MDLSTSKRKKGLIIKTWERCKSFGGSSSGSGSKDGCTNEEKGSSRIKRAFLKKRKSWPRLDAKIGKTLNNIAPIGCFSVYVGPQRQRFVIKTKYANHPLFKALLEEAEFEYGYKSEGPLELPCDVDDFLKVLLEMDRCDEMFNQQGCTFSTKLYRNASYHHLTQWVFHLPSGTEQQKKSLRTFLSLNLRRSQNHDGQMGSNRQQESI